jgi:hypothetical protein
LIVGAFFQGTRETGSRRYQVGYQPHSLALNLHLVVAGVEREREETVVLPRTSSVRYHLHDAHGTGAQKVASRLA